MRSLKGLVIPYQRYDCPLCRLNASKEGTGDNDSSNQPAFFQDKKLSFKPIQDQIREERFKRPVQVKKQSQVDGDLMLALNSHESMFNDGDFDYFQYFGQKKSEEAKWKELQEEDANHFKKNRADLVIQQKEKEKGIYVLKESKEPKQAEQNRSRVTNILLRNRERTLVQDRV